MKFSSIAKGILGLIGAVIIGAIGSGVWEKLLSPALSYISNSITSALASISTSFSDGIYKTASNLGVTCDSGVESLLFLSMIFFALFIYVLYTLRERNQAFRVIHKMLVLPFQGITGLLYVVPILIFLLIVDSRAYTIVQIQHYSTKQMEIVRPYIGENKYLVLRSQFLSMQRREDFEKFLNDLYAISKEHSINVEEFKLQEMMSLSPETFKGVLFLK